jgi:hypothetical protein
MSAAFDLEHQAARIGDMANLAHVISMAAYSLESLGVHDASALQTAADAVEQELRSVRTELDHICECMRKTGR